MKNKTTLNKDLTKIELFNLLDSFNYFDYLEDKIFKATYSIIYGKKESKSIDTVPFFEVATKYQDHNLYYLENERMGKWVSTLQHSEKFEKEPQKLLVEMIDILDWGNVWDGNLKTVLTLFRENKLVEYMKKINTYLKEPTLITDDDFNDVKMSSGWTKIYSYTFDNLVIYDSRVSAFLNYTLENSYLKYREKNDSTEIKNNIDRICFYLYNFGGGNGANDRLRQVEILNNFRRKSQPENNKHGFNANIVATWICEYIIKNCNENNIPDITIRTLERTFFMLGFDLKQL